MAQKILSADDVREAFAAAVQDVKMDTDDVIHNLSHALASLQEAGVDVSYHVAGWSGANTFKAGMEGQKTSPFSGILTIGNNQHVLSFIKTGANAKHLVLGYLNVALGDNVDNRFWSFDTTSADCYVELQKQIMLLAARNAYIASHDVASAFRMTTDKTKGAISLHKPNRTP